MSTRTRNILLVITALIVIFLAWYFRSIVSYIIVSAILAMVGRPLVRWLSSIKIWKIRLSVSLSAFITLVLIWAVVFGFFRFMIPLLAGEFEQLANIDTALFLAQFEKPIAQLSAFFYGEPISIHDQAFLEMINTKVSSVFNISQVTDIFGTIAGTIGGLLFGIFSISFITFFFLKEEGMFKRALLLLAPSEYEDRFAKSLERIHYLLRRYIIGILIEIILVMTLDAIGLTIVGLDFSDAVVIGMVCGLFNVIPYLGPWLGAATGVLIGLALNINADFMGETLPLIGFMVLVFGSVQVLDNVLFQPLIYSSSVKAHPLEIFLVILAAGSLAGIVGMILAIPVYTIIRVFAAEFLSNVKLVQKIAENMNKPTRRERHKEKK